DKASNEVIVDILNTTDIPVLSEEGKLISYNERSNWENLWIVDPLDGTKEFVKKNGEFTVNIALVSNQKPILGIIYVPVLKILYFADLELGAFKLNDIDIDHAFSSIDEIKEKGIRLPENQSNRKYTIVGSRSHMSTETEEFINKLKAQHGDIEFISKGSSLKLCQIAEGAADIYPRFAPTMEWDTAAGQAIVEISGGKIYEAESKKTLLYNKESLLNPWFIVTR
ncbi:3'(2'),5'-bisphosphate nucleotidase CysQ, partial [Bacteroidota bacterium]